MHLCQAQVDDEFDDMGLYDGFIRATATDT